MTTEVTDRPATQRLGAFRQAAQDARQAASRLRDRVRTGDGLVTAREFAEADAAIEISDLRLEAAEKAAADEQEAERKEANDRAADAYLKAEAEIKAEMIEAANAVRQALAKVGQVAERHAQIEAAGRLAANGAPPDYRLTVDRLGLRVDRRPAPGAMNGPAWAWRLYAEMTGQAPGTDPGLWPVEAQKVVGK